MGKSWSNGLGGTVVIGSNSVKFSISYALVGLPMYIHVYYQGNTADTATLTGSDYTDPVEGWKVATNYKWYFGRITPTSTSLEVILTSSGTISNVLALVMQ